MIIVDSHAHLFYDEIYKDIKNKLHTATLNDVKYILTVSTNEASVRTNIEICYNFNNICCSVGVHPHEFRNGYHLEFFKSVLNNKFVVAIGEVGLDYHFKDSTSLEDQKKLFYDMLSLGNLTDLPYIIHARDCFPDIIDIMKDYNIPNAVFHCYTDNLENAKRILDLGYYISFSGVITFKKSVDLREILKYIPNDKILIETDCPYLAPVPYRGKSNEPVYIRFIAECAAEIKKQSLEEFAKQTTDNFFKLFSKAGFLLEKSE
ncbi:MAG: TatD family hydrolase [Holosporales bacterium]|jgi:TatD DNase family protein|nr:TatD family hydrolase [Holosporales bacterium]